MRVRKSWSGLFGLLLLVALAITACGKSTPTPETMMEEEMPEEMMATETPDEMMKETSDEMMATETPDEMMKETSDEMMATETPDEMMKETSEEMMATETSDEMMEEASDEMMVTETPDEMMEETSDEMMATGTPDAMMETGTPEAMMEEAELVLDVVGLEDLGEGWAYEGWLIVDGAPLSTGVFTVDGMGHLSVSSFGLPAENLDKATAFVLTIEPSPDSDPAPSAIHVLAGDLVDGVAQLGAGHAAALGDDFTAAAASYILGIPSSDSADDSYTSGIWFDGLDLPELPEGWIYEGWVVGPDGPISTGRFTTKTMADSDGVGPTAGPNAGPNFPGQDFLNPPIDLTSGYAVVISIEPEPDNSPAPFFFKPLLDENVEDVGDHGSQRMQNVADTFPSGQATLDVDAMMEQE